MSIDTAEKRFSAVNITSPWRGINAFPDGITLDTADRLGVDYLYGGFAVGQAFTLTALSGSFSISGSDAILSPTTHINSSQERFSAMNISSPWRGLNTFPSIPIDLADRFSLKNYYTGFAVTAVNNYTITCESGVFVWDGEPSFSDFEISCESGVFTIEGFDATIIATRTMTLDSGVYAWIGYDATLIKFTERTLTATSGVFAWSGNDANFTTTRFMTALSGSFEWLGRPTTLTWANAAGIDLRPPDIITSGGHPWLQQPSKRKKRRKEELETVQEVVTEAKFPGLERTERAMNRAQKEALEKKKEADRKRQEEEDLLLG